MNCFVRFAFAGALAVLVSGPGFAQLKVGNQPTQPSGPQFGAINQTPFFSDPGLRTHLRLTDDQFTRLNTIHTDQFNRFNTARGQLGADLTDQQRAQRMQELSTTFFRDFGTAANEVLSADQRQRFNQLGLQFRGFDAFNDPAVQQQLRLNEKQLEQFRRLGQDFNTQLSEISRGFETDRAGATRRFNDLRTNMGDRINSVLTNEQRTNFRGMVGEPFNFQPVMAQPKPQPKK